MITDSIAGRNVSNAATGNLLEGARIELPQLGLLAFTEKTAHRPRQRESAAAPRAGRRVTGARAGRAVV